VVIAVEGFLFTTRCGTLTPAVPCSAWFTLVVMYFLGEQNKIEVAIPDLVQFI
jgi:hypothetical protein